MTSEIAEIKSMIKGLALGRDPQARVCGICADQSHPTDLCPQLQDPTIADVHAMGGYGPPRPRFDNQANNYNPRWNDHPGFRWNDPAGGQQQNQAQQNNHRIHLNLNTYLTLELHRPKIY